MYMMPQLWPMLATEISYIMNMLQYVYYFYACIECTYIAAILHNLYSMMMIISCLDHQPHDGSEKGCMISKTNI